MDWSEPPPWSEPFPARKFSFAHEAAQYMLDITKGSITDDALNAFVLCWGNAAGDRCSTLRNKIGIESGNIAGAGGSTVIAAT